MESIIGIIIFKWNTEKNGMENYIQMKVLVLNLYIVKEKQNKNIVKSLVVHLPSS